MIDCIFFSWGSLQTDPIGYMGKKTVKYWQAKKYPSLGACIGDKLTPICGSIWSALGQLGAGVVGMLCRSAVASIPGALWATWCAGEVTAATIICTNPAEPWDFPEEKEQKMQPGVT